MIRYAPTEPALGAAMYGRGKPSGAATFTRTVGGDELNTMVRPVCGRALAPAGALPVHLRAGRWR